MNLASTFASRIVQDQRRLTLNSAMTITYGFIVIVWWRASYSQSSNISESKTTHTGASQMIESSRRGALSATVASAQSFIKIVRLRAKRHQLALTRARSFIPELIFPTNLYLRAFFLALAGPVVQDRWRRALLPTVAPTRLEVKVVRLYAFDSLSTFLASACFVVEDLWINTSDSTMTVASLIVKIVRLRTKKHLLATTSAF